MRRKGRKTGYLSVKEAGVERGGVYNENYLYREKEYLYRSIEVVERWVR